jgi:hypothetical protein
VIHNSIYLIKIVTFFEEEEHLSSHTVTKSIISDNLFSSIEIVKLSVSNKIPIKTILGLVKKNLKRAYRQIYLDPGDIHLLGYK